MEYGAETGWYLTGTRYYDPAMGRFISPDDVLDADHENIAQYNLYSYCFNNPVNGVNWNSTFSHMLQRMTQRGMSRSTVQWVINNGKMLAQGGGKYLYVSKRGAVVMTAAGKLITGYGSNYFDSAMEQVIKQLFG